MDALCEMFSPDVHKALSENEEWAVSTCVTQVPFILMQQEVELDVVLNILRVWNSLFPLAFSFSIELFGIKQPEN